jgi:hypothetical protein
MNSFGLKPSSFYHRGVLLGWYVTFATFLMTEQNYKSFFDFSIFLKKYFLACVTKKSCSTYLIGNLFALNTRAKPAVHDFS